MRFIKNFMNRFGEVEEDEMDIEMALREALANAIIHGNHGDPHKRIHATCRCQMDGEVSITVRDEGNGFDVAGLQDPTDSNRRSLSDGRGIYLMRAFMDEVSFDEHGSIVRMRKKLRTA